TICEATSTRQFEAETLARQADIMIVVGGKNSSNTNKLVKICKQHLKDTYHVETLDEIRSDWFVGKRRIGVTGGASTPHEFVDRVGSFIKTLLEAQQ
ncbi:MAG: bifunctional 4-hydroxy-3-methylbut-2-enyl diphosphate reductase/30S ribosomal protein S1, partial [Deltaproteobacteria bacterium]|nr:bifunctional 4-hydroxy-3-methylbut-2-enyl diphosphate reductase/30S ribosomal protein S1 [Deltaproteobacteria bacterium]